MLEPKLSKKVFVFEKCFYYKTGELNNIENDLNLIVELTVDFIDKKFYLDLNQPFHTEKGVLIVYADNTLGNTYEKVQTSKEFYLWLAEICGFAAEELNEKDQYDPLTDSRVITYAIRFAQYLDNENTDLDDKFREYVIEEKLKKKKKGKRNKAFFPPPYEDTDEKDESLDDNK